ncbi:MAG: glutaredoxin 3 [marine bacterium B5-7]|nr:MAG: glutaredoxin 3 [marine bacterium B5-7]
MAKVIVYSKPSCPYCVRAEQLLQHKGVAFEKVRVDLDAEALKFMMEKSGRRTVPQIFINDEPIGGFDDLYALDKSGKLDGLLT